MKVSVYRIIKDFILANLVMSHYKFVVLMRGFCLKFYPSNMKRSFVYRLQLSKKLFSSILKTSL